MNEFTQIPTAVKASNDREQQVAPKFPRAILSVSREEFYGQDCDREPLELTIKDGKTGEETQLPDDLQGHLFIIAPAGSVDSPQISKSQLETVTPSKNGWIPVLNGDGMVYRLDFYEVRGGTGGEPPRPLKCRRGSGLKSRSISDKTPQKEKSGKAWLATRLVKTPSYYVGRVLHDCPERYPNLSKGLQFIT